MGKLIQLAQTRKHKILLIVFGVLGALFILLGVILSVTMTSPNARTIQVRASGVQQMGNEYIIPVVTRHTPITLVTDPVGAPLRLTILEGNDFVDFPTHAVGGREIVITLLNNDAGTPTFYDGTAATRVRIAVSGTGSGGQTVVLNIQAALEPSQVSMSTTIQRRDAIGTPWSTTDRVSFLRYRQGQNLETGIQQVYRVISTFSVMGTPIYSTDPASAVFNRGAFADVELTLDTVSGIRLFNHPPPPGTNMMFLHIPNDNAFYIGIHNFAINVNFQGETFTDFFNLRIVP